MSLPLSGDWLACYLLLMHAPSLSLYPTSPPPPLSPSLPRTRSTALCLSLLLTISVTLAVSFSVFLSVSQSIAYFSLNPSPTTPPSSFLSWLSVLSAGHQFLLFFRFWSGGVRESLCGGRINVYTSLQPASPVRWPVAFVSDRAVGRSWISVSASHASQLRQSVELCFSSVWGGGGLFGRWE